MIRRTRDGFMIHIRHVFSKRYFTLTQLSVQIRDHVLIQTEREKTYEWEFELC